MGETKDIEFTVKVRAPRKWTEALIRQELKDGINRTHLIVIEAVQKERA